MTFKFAVFAGYDYEACGGFKDIYALADNFEEAKQYAKQSFKKMKWKDRPEVFRKNNPFTDGKTNYNLSSISTPETLIYGFHWAHIVDLQIYKIIYHVRKE